MVSASNWLIVALAATAMVGCASTATQAPDAAAAPQANAASYIIGPGDSLDIFVWYRFGLAAFVIIVLFARGG